MTSLGYGVDDLDRLVKSPADWISPNPDHFDYKNDPPASDGAKVIILDTDHLWGVGGNVPWVWKSFLRGQNRSGWTRWTSLLQGTDPDECRGCAGTIWATRGVLPNA
jgi:hypothetical protein